MIGLRAVVVALLVVAPARARAQDGHGGGADHALELVVVQTASDADGDDWRRRLDAALVRGGHVVPDARTDEDVDELFVVESARLGALDPARVDALAQVAELLAGARADAAALREGRALAALAQAAQIAEAHADVPGAAAWNAEVQTAIGVVAAQAGLAQASADALARAATLDASRGVRAAEATPAVVAQAAEIARRIATGPSGGFEVVADAPGARVFLDDADVGVAPRTVRAPVGRHVLRIEAPGRRPYGTMLDVFEGAAPPLRVTLDEDPLLALGRALTTAARAGEPTGVRAAVRALAREGVTVEGVWIVRAGAGDRALLTLVGTDGADRRWGATRAALPERLRAPRDLDDAGAVADADDAFLRPRQIGPTPRGDAFWQGPWPWIIGGVVLAAGAAATIGVAAQPQEAKNRIIILY